MSVHQFRVIRCMYARPPGPAGSQRDRSSQTLSPESTRTLQRWEQCTHAAMTLVVSESLPTQAAVTEETDVCVQPCPYVSTNPQHNAPPPHLRLVAKEETGETCMAIAHSKAAVWQSVDLQLWVRYTRQDGNLRKFRILLEHEASFKSCLAVLSRYMVIKAAQAPPPALATAAQRPSVAGTHLPPLLSQPDVGPLSIPHESDCTCTNCQASSSGENCPLHLEPSLTLYDSSDIPDKVVKHCLSKLSNADHVQLRSLPWLACLDLDAWSRRVEHELRLAAIRDNPE
ncbi:hypothetical protein BASA83_004968 [Batrachochytrium salamandrivorans]|nr:hypothetical protein BASA83_004968 [Batrachochytrium salamandrivorans]